VSTDARDPRRPDRPAGTETGPETETGTGTAAGTGPAAGATALPRDRALGATAALVDPDQLEAVEHDRRVVLATAAFGALMVVVAAVVLVDAASLAEADEAVGPAAVPTLVGVLLAVVGAALLVRALVDLRTATAGPRLPRERLLRLLAMVGVLLAFTVLLPVVGYVVAAAGLFTGAAVLLGAPHPLRTLAYGWTLAAVAYLLFDQLIGVSLPTGPWGF
jgi:putative tricarboxylic transport membrane protein